MTHEGLFNEIKLGEEIKKLKKQLKEVKMQMTVDLKEAKEINKLHQELNGVLRVKLDLEKKNHTITREDVQLKDIEIGRLMEKLNKKKA